MKAVVDTDTCSADYKQAVNNLVHHQKTIEESSQLSAIFKRLDIEIKAYVITLIA